MDCTFYKEGKMQEQKRKCGKDGCITLLSTHNPFERCFVHKGFNKDVRGESLAISNLFGGASVGRFFDLTEAQYQGRRLR